jgi:cysteine-rich repeat protein
VLIGVQRQASNDENAAHLECEMCDASLMPKLLPSLCYGMIAIGCFSAGCDLYNPKRSQKVEPPDASLIYDASYPNLDAYPDARVARCGDGILDRDRGETCDDGNTVSGDGCSSNCNVNERCGNGVRDPGEQCDTQSMATPTCDVDCTVPMCGDRVVNQAAGEQCDDGNTIDNDGCTNRCQVVLR